MRKEWSRLFFIFCVISLLIAGAYTQDQMRLTLSSPDFSHNAFIPERFSCDGRDINPTLDISESPKETKSLALIVDDPDAPMGTWVHWVVFNIPVIRQIKEDSVPGVLGRNDFGRTAFGGPCPPSGTHRYFFKLYAVDAMLDLQTGASFGEVEKALNGHVLERAQLIGLYKRK